MQTLHQGDEELKPMLFDTSALIIMRQFETAYSTSVPFSCFPSQDRSVPKVTSRRIQLDSEHLHKENTENLTPRTLKALQPKNSRVSECMTDISSNRNSLKKRTRRSKRRARTRRNIHRTGKVVASAPPSSPSPDSFHLPRPVSCLNPLPRVSW